MTIANIDMHRRRNSEIGDLAMSTVIPGDMFPPDVNSQVDTNITAVVEGDVIEAPLGDDAMGAPPSITPTSTKDIAVTTTTMAVVDEEAIIHEDVVIDQSTVVQDSGKPATAAAALSTSPDGSSLADIGNGEVNSIQNSALRLRKRKKPCTGGKAEVWVGRHPAFIEQDRWWDHSKIWVISSDSSEHSSLKDVWKDLLPSWVRTGYKGDKGCAKFYTIGAGGENGELIGRVNRVNNDVTSDLLDAVFVGRDINPASLKTTVEKANTIMNGNFQRTLLEYEMFPDDWNSGGPGWEEFNSNGYISGLLSFLGYIGKKPKGGNLPGWNKPVPKAFFTTSYYNNAGVLNAVIKAHTCTGGKAEVWVGRHSVVPGVADHAKIWVISSDSKEHASPNVVWNHLWPSRVPGGYKGDRGCAKFYTIGAEGVKSLSSLLTWELTGKVNRDEDKLNDLLGAAYVYNADPVTLKTSVDKANVIMNGNFQRTILEYDLYPDAISGGSGWEE